MGKPEECAGLIQLGIDPPSIAALLRITTESVIDYLYRAVGKRYISTADIVLAIPPTLRQAADSAAEELGTEYWYSVYRSLEASTKPPHRDLLKLYLHLRGAIAGDFYYHVTEIEKALYSFLKDSLDEGFSYRYFSDLVKAVKSDEPHFRKLLAPLAEDPISALEQVVAIRNRVMHPTPPFSPSDEEYLFVRGIHRRVYLIKGQQAAEDDFELKVRQSALAVLAKAEARIKEGRLKGDA